MNFRTIPNIERPVVPPKKSPAPALTRGLELLRILKNQSPLSLDELAKKINAPKSTVFRLLEVLEDMSFVEKDLRKKTYRPLVQIVPSFPRGSFNTRKLNQVMHDLSDKTGLTVEWFVPNDEGMVRVDHVMPAGEMHVRSDLGYTFKWTGTMVSVNILGLAFFNDEVPKGKNFTIMRKPGELGSLSRAELVDMVKKAHAERLFTDPFPEPRGNQRVSALVQEGGRPLGILAVAGFVGLAKGSKLPKDITRFLNQAAEELSQQVF